MSLPFTSQDTQGGSGAPPAQAGSVPPPAGPPATSPAPPAPAPLAAPAGDQRVNDDDVSPETRLEPQSVIPVANDRMNKKNLVDISTQERTLRMFLEAELAALRASGTSAAAMANVNYSQQDGPQSGQGSSLTTPAASAATAMSSAQFKNASDASERLNKVEELLVGLINGRFGGAPPAAPVDPLVGMDSLYPPQISHQGPSSMEAGEGAGGTGPFGQRGAQYHVQGKFDGILKLFEEGRRKEILQNMAGKLDPFDLWKCVPSSHRVSGQAAEEGPKPLVWGEGGSVMIEDKKASKKARLEKLLGYLPNPLAFISAWTWFITLTQYWYEDPVLSHSMLEFGWQIVKCDSKFYWHDCLEMFVDVSGKLIRSGVLHENAELFAHANLAGASMLLVQRSDMRTSATAPVSNTTNAPANAAIAPPTSKANYCHNWNNRGACTAASLGRPCQYAHKCLKCEDLHPRYLCPKMMQNNGSAQAQVQQMHHAVFAQPQYLQPMSQTGPYMPDNLGYVNQQPYYGQYQALPAMQQHQAGVAPAGRQANGPFNYGKQGAAGNQYFGNRGLKRDGPGA